ncbi:MAG: hypothetical protein FWD05_14475 [Oscillospiraceae bacterium]|nr:hypothetical protein [Oscillospiraceae bacterium]
MSEETKVASRRDELESAINFFETMERLFNTVNNIVGISRDTANIFRGVQSAFELEGGILDVSLSGLSGVASLYQGVGGAFQIQLGLFGFLEHEANSAEWFNSVMELMQGIGNVGAGGGGIFNAFTSSRGNLKSNFIPGANVLAGTAQTARAIIDFDNENLLSSWSEIISGALSTASGFIAATPLKAFAAPLSVLSIAFSVAAGFFADGDYVMGFMAIGVGMVVSAVLFKLAKVITGKIGKSLFSALESIQDNAIETITTIIWGAMQPFNANFPFDKAAGLFDKYIDDGNSIEDLMMEINGLFEASGFFSKGQD